jgi:hypothetical protein
MSLIVPVLRGLTGLVISSTEGDAAQRPERVIPYFGRMVAEDMGEEGDDPTLHHNFVVIPPGGMYKRRYLKDADFDEYVVLDVRNPAAKFQKKDLRGKRIFVQLQMNYLRFSQSQADELALRWKRYGSLWTGTVRSNPIEIDIPKLPEFADCSEEYRID